ncbi:MAG: hypothetical protein ACREA9_06640, partial [Pyrinomonadaceae bacterium]
STRHRTHSADLMTADIARCPAIRTNKASTIRTIPHATEDTDCFATAPTIESAIDANAMTACATFKSSILTFLTAVSAPPRNRCQRL